MDKEEKYRISKGASIGMSVGVAIWLFSEIYFSWDYRILFGLKEAISMLGDKQFWFIPLWLILTGGGIGMLVSAD